MKQQSLMATVAVVGLAAARVVLPSVSAAQTPPMGGGYANVIPIPVPENDPQVKAIAGALFKPEGKGPFPAIIYMSGCAGLGIPPDMAQQKAVIDHYLAHGKAVLHPRFADATWHAKRGLRQNGRNEHLHASGRRRLFRAEGARRDARNRPASASSSKAIRTAPTRRRWRSIRKSSKEPGGNVFAGVIAYYPYCVNDMQFSAPTVILDGDKDDWTPSNLCEAIKDRPNLEMAVFPGATHAFTMPMDQPVEFMGHHIAYDAKATKDAEARADAFIAAHMQ